MSLEGRELLANSGAGTVASTASGSRTAARSRTPPSSTRALQHGSGVKEWDELGCGQRGYGPTPAPCSTASCSAKGAAARLQQPGADAQCGGQRGCERGAALSPLSLPLPLSLVVA